MTLDPSIPKPHAPKGPLKARPIDAADHKDAPQCRATAKGSGQRCKRRPIPGGPVCVKHGGGAPQVQKKAMERLLALQYPAISRLAELIAQTEFPSTAMAAVKDALDRTLGKPVESVSLEHSGSLEIAWKD